MKKVHMLLISNMVLALSLANVFAGEVGFNELFALSQDRDAALAELLPGSPEFYFFSCLNHQNKGELSKVEPLLEQWRKRHGEGGRFREIETRQMLLSFESQPKKTLDYLKRNLSLNFNHQRDRLNPEVNHPTQLDLKLLDTERLLSAALKDRRGLSGVQDAAVEKLVKRKLTVEQRADLLKRLQRPDVPGLVELVEQELRWEKSSGFGHYAIHRNLLKSQLDTLRRNLPSLSGDDRFVRSYLQRLLPDSDSGWQSNPAEKRACYERFWNFAEELPSSQTSLKVCVLYHLLDLSRSEGRYDRDLFVKYLKLPRPSHYVAKPLRDSRRNGGYIANLNDNFSEHTTLPPVRNDETLIRDYLAHFLVDANDASAFAEWLEKSYLEDVLAETKLLAGKGDAERWYGLLNAGQIQALRDRVDLAFTPRCPEFVTSDSEVSLEVAVKNVERMTVKIYDINAFNVYREGGKEINAAMDLDGLVANYERTVEFGQTPIIRHVEQLSLKEIEQPGMYIVELVGNGVSSRALIRKGDLFVTQRTGSAGHIFRIFSDDGKPAEKAELWMKGQLYSADEDGEIAVPFSTVDGTAMERMILRSGRVAVLQKFGHLPEVYKLDADFLVDREALIAGETAQLLLRTSLSVHGHTADMALLKDSVLEVSSVDEDGAVALQRYDDPSFTRGADLVQELRVPARLRRLTFALRGKVRNLSRNRDDALSANDSLELNGVLSEARVEDLFLRETADGHFIELRGRTGEPLARRAVNIELRHSWVTQPVRVTLQTDEKGRLTLGRMPPQVVSVSANAAGANRSWMLYSRGGWVRLPEAMHLLEGEECVLPFVGETPERVTDAVSLISWVGRGKSRVYMSDLNEKVTINNGELRVAGLAPGDYQLWLKREMRAVTLRVTKGKRQGEVLVGRRRALEAPLAGMPRLVSVVAENEQVKIQVADATPDTRIHVLARTLAGNVPRFGEAMPWMVPSEMQWASLANGYVSGRKVGDEARYVLERRYADRYPGNMLRRPSLLLSPWSPRKTDTSKQDAAGGESWAADEALARGSHGGRASGIRGSATSHGGGGAGSSTIDFLPQPAVVMANLTCGTDGTLTILRKAFGAHTQISVMLVDAPCAMTRVALLPDVVIEPRDLRLAKALDPAAPQIERKQVSLLQTGESLVVADRLASSMEKYDSLSDVYRLFQSLAPSSELDEFSFLTQWPELTPEQQREKYSKYACHELNLFLKEKDPKFFRDVVLPHLANKREMQFVDLWLLKGDLTPYLAPAEFARLNAMERVLLARADNKQRESLQRHLRDRFLRIPPNPERFESLFSTALLSGGMDVDGDFMFESAEAEESVVFDGVALQNNPARTMDFATKSRRTLSESKEMARAPVAAPAVRLMAARSAPMKDMERRKSVRQLYRSPEQTREWVEMQYYRVEPAAQKAGLIPVNGFWTDLSEHDGKGAFLSEHVAEATASLSEMLCAMAFLDLPFEAEEHEEKVDGRAYDLKAASPMITYHQQLQPARQDEEAVPLMVVQNIYDMNDRYRFEGNERIEKYVRGEFVAGRVYGMKTVLSNPDASARAITLLTQIPAGAIPLAGAMETRSRRLRIQPYTTQTFESLFYFPFAGTFAQFPPHVAEDDAIVGHAQAVSFGVVDTPSQIDRESWDFLSQHGTFDEVMAYLKSHNLEKGTRNEINLERIAWRMRDKTAFGPTLSLLASRHIYNRTLWAYSAMHSDVARLREFLPNEAVANRVGGWLESPLLDVDSEQRWAYLHREYWPLVNARVYQLGRKRKIVNSQFFGQYNAYMDLLIHKPAPDARDELAVVTYLLLQDRVTESIEHAGRIKGLKGEEKMQSDYLQAYIAFYQQQPEKARKLAAPYAEYPVDRWRTRFLNVLSQADEISGANARVDDPDRREEVQNRMAAETASLEFAIVGDTIKLSSRNLESCEFRFYPLDLELLFSRNPFVSDMSSGFGAIRPAMSQMATIKSGEQATVVDIPKAMRGRNVLIEAVAGALSHRATYTPHRLDAQVVQAYGQVRVRTTEKGSPVAGAYVKVYARMRGGAVDYYKDGYTDLRGVFDYASLSTDDLTRVERFSILILDDEHGAVVKETAPPKR